MKSKEAPVNFFVYSYNLFQYFQKFFFYHRRFVYVLKILFIVAIYFVLLLFSPHIALLAYNNLYCSTKICLPDFMNYFSNAFTGLFAIIISLFALHISLRKEAASIETSKGVIRAFIEFSCNGFKENYQGKDFRYFRLKYHNLVKHLQRLISAQVLTAADVELCKKIQRRVRNIDDETSKLKKSSKAFRKIEKSYHEFWDEDEYRPNIKEILKKL